MKKLLTCLAVIGLCTSLVVADIHPVKAVPQRLDPVSVQQISRDLQPLSPVIPYTGGQGGIAQTTNLAFDAFEPNAGGVPTDNLYGYDCFPGDPVAWRWILGGTYEYSIYTVNDMTLDPSDVGKGDADRVEFLWYWNPTSGATSCEIFIFTADDFDDTCAGPPSANGYDGIIYTFAPPQPPFPKFYYTDADLAPDGLVQYMPPDGVGAMELIMSRGHTSSVIYLATRAAPGYWGTKDALANPPGTNPSHQGPIQWNDSAPPDGTFTNPTFECIDLTLGICPDPLCSSFCFYVPSAKCGDCNCDGAFDGADIDAFFLAIGDPGAYQIAYPGCPRDFVADCNGDGVVDGADIDAFFIGLGLGKCPWEP